MKTRNQPKRKPTGGRRTPPAKSAGPNRRAGKSTAVTAPSAPPAAIAAAARSDGAVGDGRRTAFAAAAQSGAILAEGLGGIGQAWIGLTQAAMHDGAATARAIIGAKTAQQVLELQANYARATLDRLMAESGKLSALSLAVANRAIEPIQSQISAAVGRLWRPAA